jgi:hypothetical protein
VSVSGLLSRLDRLGPPPVAPDDCPGEPTSWNITRRDRPDGPAEPTGRIDGYPCPHCGAEHVAELVEVLVGGKDPEGRLVWAGTGEPVEPEFLADGQDT